MRQTVLIYEDMVHELILLKLLSYLEYDVGLIAQIKPRNGKSKIDKNLQRYVTAAANKNIIVLRDLDDDAECAPAMLDKLHISNGMLGFCISLPVREAEVWLMADTAGFCNYFALRPDNVDLSIIEGASRPKKKMLTIISEGRLPAKEKRKLYKYSQNGDIQQAEQYNTKISEFIQRWDVSSAVQNSPSLRSALNRIARVLNT